MRLIDDSQLVEKTADMLSEREVLSGKKKPANKKFNLREIEAFLKDNGSDEKKLESLFSEFTSISMQKMKTEGARYDCNSSPFKQIDA